MRLSAYTDASAGHRRQPEAQQRAEVLGTAVAAAAARPRIDPPEPEQDERRGAVVAEQQAARALVQHDHQHERGGTVSATLVSDANA